MGTGGLNGCGARHPPANELMLASEQGAPLFLCVRFRVQVHPASERTYKPVWYISLAKQGEAACCAAARSGVSEQEQAALGESGWRHVWQAASSFALQVVGPFPEGGLLELQP
jgi:hypothetical protein